MTANVPGALAIEYCGLDPLFNSCLKLCICDVLSMKEHDSHLGVYCYGSHLVVTVHIMGVIVKKDIRDKIILYAVDDGTGVITCSCWKTPYGDRDLDALSQLSERISAKSLHSKLTELQKSRQEVADGFDLGTLLRIRGSVSTYGGQREIKAFQCAAVEDPNEETHRMQETLRLYQQFYDCPVCLPSILASELRGDASSDPVHQQANVLRSLTDAVLGHIDRRRLAITDINSLSVDDELAQIAAKTMKDDLWQDVFNELEARGHLCRNPQTRGQFIVVANSRELHNTVLTIINERVQQRPAEDGCHFLHIHDELQKRPIYCRLNKAALHQCITELETRSDIIETARWRYITIH